MCWTIKAEPQIGGERVRCSPLWLGLASVIQSTVPIPPCVQKVARRSRRQHKLLMGHELMWRSPVPLFLEIWHGGPWRWDGPTDFVEPLTKETPRAQSWEQDAAQRMCARDTDRQGSERRPMWIADTLGYFPGQSRQGCASFPGQAGAGGAFGQGLQYVPRLRIAKVFQHFQGSQCPQGVRGRLQVRTAPPGQELVETTADRR
jgi:hypothetical protein